MADEYVLSEDGQSIVRTLPTVITISKHRLLAREKMYQDQIDRLYGMLAVVQEQLDLFPEE